MVPHGSLLSENLCHLQPSNTAPRTGNVHFTSPFSYSYFLEVSTLEYSIPEFRDLGKKQKTKNTPDQGLRTAGKLFPTQVALYLFTATKKDKMVDSG